MGAKHQALSETNCHEFEIKGQLKDAIFIVDDDRETLSLLYDFFKVKGYRPICFSNSVDAIEHLKHMLRHSPVDLGRIQTIILDLTMPNLNGFEFISKLRDAKINIPTILITSMSDRYTEAAARKQGATAFLAKPFSLHKLLNIATSF